MPADPVLKIKLQLMCGEEIAMGPGKADLLDAIRVEGSISAGGRALGMSYRRAWMLVDTLNRCWSEAVVETSPGSSHGGGARVTPFGETILRQYRTLQQRVESASHDDALAALNMAMLPAPKRSQKD